MQLLHRDCNTVVTLIAVNNISVESNYYHLKTSFIYCLESFIIDCPTRYSLMNLTNY
jgi:hypothetical protein